MTVCAILQSNYLPWKGYFQIIKNSDIFVFLDDVQFTKNDWRNRNILKSRDGNEWLSIPVGRSTSRLIDEVKLPNDHTWRIKHCNKIQNIYGKAKHYAILEELIMPIILDQKISELSQLNRKLIYAISSFLKIDTEFTDSREVSANGDRVGKLIDICNKLEAQTYLSGPAAMEYIGDGFEKCDVEIKWMNYGPFLEYQQFSEPFDNHVSIIDLIAHTGVDAHRFIPDQ